MEHPEIYLHPEEYPNIKKSNRLPADALPKIEYANTICHKHTVFRVIQQWYDSKHAYLNYIEIRTEEPLRLWISCPREELYWSYQIQGQCKFDPQVVGSNFVLREEEYRVTYASTGKFSFNVDPGVHIMCFFILESEWVLSLESTSALIRAFELQRRDVRISPPLYIDNQINRYLLELFTLAPESEVAHNTRVIGFIGELVGISFRDLKKNRNKSQNSRQAVEEVRAYIRDQVKKGQLPRIYEIARHFGLSIEYLRQQHRVHFKGTLQKYMIDLKLEEAMRLLKEEGYSVTEVTYKLGYGDVGTFSNQFKKHFGISPSRVRSNKH